MRKPTGIIIFTLLFLILSISCSSLLYTNTKKQADEYVLIWSTDNDGGSGKYNSYNEMTDLDKEYAITAFSYLTSSNDIQLGGNNNGYQLGLLSAPIKVWDSWNHIQDVYIISNFYNSDEIMWVYSHNKEIPTSVGGMVLYTPIEGLDGENHVIVLDQDGNTWFGTNARNSLTYSQYRKISIDNNFDYPGELIEIVNQNQKAGYGNVMEAALEFIEKRHHAKKVHVIFPISTGFNSFAIAEDNRIFKLIGDNVKTRNAPRGYYFLANIFGYEHLISSEGVEYLIASDSEKYKEGYDFDWFSRSYKTDDIFKDIANRIRDAGFLYMANECFTYLPETKSLIVTETTYPLGHIRVVDSYSPFQSKGFLMLEAPENGTPNLYYCVATHVNHNDTRELLELQFEDKDGNVCVVKTVAKTELYSVDTVHDYKITMTNTPTMESIFMELSFFDITSAIPTLDRMIDNNQSLTQNKILDLRVITKSGKVELSLDGYDVYRLNEYFKRYYSFVEEYMIKKGSYK